MQDCIHVRNLHNTSASDHQCTIAGARTVLLESNSLESRNVLL
jgi:hypothetical protein